MEMQDAVHEFRRCVLVLAEFDAAAEQSAFCREAVQPDVRAVDDGLDEALVGRFVNLRPERRDKRVANPVEHASVRDEVVFDIRIRRIRCRTVAPCAPAADEVQRRHDALPVEICRLRDREDILFGIQQGFDYIAASFVRTAADVRELRDLLDRHDSNIRIIAKIENQEGVSNLPDILAVADGVMVARGDMGVEIDFTEIPLIQKNMITQCVACGKPVITATQMLDSMMENPRPTRAEITDVANAIYDGTSASMLSGETGAEVKVPLFINEGDKIQIDTRTGEYLGRSKA